jgi:hypothetical protein
MRARGPATGAQAPQRVALQSCSVGGAGEMTWVEWGKRVSGRLPARERRKERRRCSGWNCDRDWDWDWDWD